MNEETAKTVDKTAKDLEEILAKLQIIEEILIGDKTKSK